MKNFNSEHIEKYLLGLLSAEDTQKFETVLDQNNELQQEVKLQEQFVKRTKRNALAVLVQEAGKRHERKNSGGFWSNGRIYLLSVVLVLAALGTVVYLNTGEEALPANIVEVEKVEQDSNPARKPLIIPFKQYTFLAEKGATIKDKRAGAKIYIPKNALTDCAGNILSGEVTLKYREFRNEADIAISHLPMTYKDQNFNSAGMFEMRAYQGEKEVCLAEGSNASIDFVMTKNEEGIGYYALDDNTEEWEFLEEIPVWKRQAEVVEKEEEEMEEIQEAEPKTTVAAPLVMEEDLILTEAYYDKIMVNDTTPWPFELLHKENPADQFKRAMAALDLQPKPEPKELLLLDDMFNNELFIETILLESKDINIKRIRANYTYKKGYRFPWKFLNTRKGIILKENEITPTKQEMEIGSNVYDEMLLMNGMKFDLVNPVLAEDPIEGRNFDDFRLTKKRSNTYNLRFKNVTDTKVFTDVLVTFNKDYLENELPKTVLGEFANKEDLTLEEKVYKRYKQLHKQRENRVNENLERQVAEQAVADSLRQNVLMDSLYFYGQESVDNMAELIMTYAEFEAKEETGKQKVYDSPEFQQKVAAYLDTLKSLGNEADAYVQQLIQKGKDRNIIKKVPKEIPSLSEQANKQREKQRKKAKAYEQLTGYQTGGRYIPDAGHTYPALVRNLPIRNFGVYNCDQVMRMKNRVQVMAEYEDEDGNKITEGYIMSVINKKVNGAFSFDANRFTFDPSATKALLLFTLDNRLYILKNESMEREYQTGKKYVFKMKEITEKVENSADLMQQLLNQPS